MRILTSAAGLAVVAMLATPAKAQDAYVIGLTGALTGPSASTTAPPVEGLRIYIDRINAAGGINGKPVKLRILDDQADPQKAAANARQLVGQENAVLLIDSSLSSTYAPVIAEAKRADVPLMFVGAVCPKEVYPPAEFGTVLHQRIRVQPRQQRRAQFHQEHRDGSGAHRPCRHDHPDLARRSRLRRRPGEHARHDRGG